VLQSAADALLAYGLQTATSRLGFGNSPPVLEVERRAREFLSHEDACYLVSGYAANFALCAAAGDRVDLALVDESAHDSLREAARGLNLRQAPILFRHRDADHLAELLHARLRAGWRAMVMTDGIFSVSGRMAPLANYLSVLDRYTDSILLVDDAHGLAVVGENGQGSLEFAGVQAEWINCMPNTSDGRIHVVHTATLSKAVGGHGGVITGSRAFIADVRSRSGWFRGASAPAAPVAAGTAKALEIVQTTPDLRRTLAANIDLLRAGLRSLGLDVELAPSPIVGIALETADRMQEAQRRLTAEGILIAYVRDYAGAGPLGMLRIAVFATHTREMIERLVDALRRAI
jgi:7-keto-8-aminopelargonate synthetase-like enzyme